MGVPFSRLTPQVMRTNSLAMIGADLHKQIRCCPDTAQWQYVKWEVLCLSDAWTQLTQTAVELHLVHCGG